MQTEGGSHSIQQNQTKTSFHISVTTDFHQSDPNPKDNPEHFPVFSTLGSLYNPCYNLQPLFSLSNLKINHFDRTLIWAEVHCHLLRWMSFGGSRLTDEVAHVGIRGGNRYNRHDRETLLRSPSILMPHTETTRELCLSCLLPDLSQQPELYLIVLSWWADSEAWRGVRGRSCTTVSLVSSHSVMCSGALQQNHAGFTWRNPVPNHSHPSQVIRYFEKVLWFAGLEYHTYTLILQWRRSYTYWRFYDRLQYLYGAALIVK